MEAAPEWARIRHEVEKNHTQNLSLASHRQSHRLLRPLHCSHFSIQSPLLCGSLWRNAISTSGETSCRCLVLLDRTVGDTVGFARFPPIHTSDPPEPPDRSSIAYHWQIVDIQWRFGCILDPLFVRNRHWNMVASITGLLCHERPRGQTDCGQQPSGCYRLDRSLCRYNDGYGPTSSG